MKIILTEDVKSQGKKGDVLTVSDGFGRNLISKKQAIEATPKALNDLKLQNQHADKVAQEQYENALALKARLESLTVTCKLKAGEKGRSFGSISSKEISAALKEQFDLDVDKKKMHLAEALKNLGTYEVKVKLHAKVQADLKVRIVEG